MYCTLVQREFTEARNFFLWVLGFRSQTGILYTARKSWKSDVKLWSFGKIVRCVDDPNDWWSATVYNLDYLDWNAFRSRSPIPLIEVPFNDVAIYLYTVVRWAQHIGTRFTVGPIFRQPCSKVMLPLFAIVREQPSWRSYGCLMKIFFSPIAKFFVANFFRWSISLWSLSFAEISRSTTLINWYRTIVLRKDFQVSRDYTVSPNVSRMQSNVAKIITA